MKKIAIMFAVFSAISANAIAADYSYIDAGDVYYVNDWGSDNRKVVVLRKLGSGMLKVRDTYSGETSKVRSSDLLTRSELQAEEAGNAAASALVGAALVYCIFSADGCNDK